MQITALTSLWCVVYMMLSSHDAILVKNLQLLHGYDAMLFLLELLSELDDLLT